MPPKKAAATYLDKYDKALAAIDKSLITEIRALAKLPPAVAETLRVVCLVIGEKKPTHESMLKTVGHTDFLADVRYTKEQIQSPAKVDTISCVKSLVRSVVSSCRNKIHQTWSDFTNRGAL